MKLHTRTAVPATVLGAAAALATISYAAGGLTGARPLARTAVAALCEHRIGNGHKAISKH